jgi:hypothetical protein
MLKLRNEKIHIGQSSLIFQKNLINIFTTYVFQYINYTDL